MWSALEELCMMMSHLETTLKLTGDPTSADGYFPLQRQNCYGMDTY